MILKVEKCMVFFTVHDLLFYIILIFVIKLWTELHKNNILFSLISLPFFDTKDLKTSNFHHFLYLFLARKDLKISYFHYLFGERNWRWKWNSFHNKWLIYRRVFILKLTRNYSFHYKKTHITFCSNKKLWSLLTLHSLHSRTLNHTAFRKDYRTALLLD